MTLTRDERRDVAAIFREIELLAREGKEAMRRDPAPLPAVIIFAKSIQEQATLAIQRLVRDTVD